MNHSHALVIDRECVISVQVNKLQENFPCLKVLKNIVYQRIVFNLIVLALSRNVTSYILASERNFRLLHLRLLFNVWAKLNFETTHPTSMKIAKSVGILCTIAIPAECNECCS